MRRFWLFLVLYLGMNFAIEAQTNIVTTNSTYTHYSFPAFTLLNKLRSDFANPTNSYNAGETVAEMAPTISSPNISSSKDSYTIGYSLEVEHWTSKYMGTGFEIGSYDYSKNTIDHIAIMEDFRYVPFENYFFWNRLALGFKSGAENFFTDNTKDLEIGGEIYWHFSKNVRLEADIVQHERTNSSKNGQTARCAIQWVF